MISVGHDVTADRPCASVVGDVDYLFSWAASMAVSWAGASAGVESPDASCIVAAAVLSPARESTVVVVIESVLDSLLHVAVLSHDAKLKAAIAIIT